ncbi:MAG: energy transducer TonB [Nitrospirae bacterium]|nr:MAG: energy transducer TonB [Nitrospirota bacterium]
MWAKLLVATGPLAWISLAVLLVCSTIVLAEDQLTNSDSEAIDVLPTFHVYGFRIHPGQERGPVPVKTPWPVIPSSLLGEELDDRVVVRFLVDAAGGATPVILEPASHQELTNATMSALRQWTFLPKLRGDVPVESELTVRIHFRTR